MRRPLRWTEVWGCEVEDWLILASAVVVVAVFGTWHEVSKIRKWLEGKDEDQS